MHPRKRADDSTNSYAIFIGLVVIAVLCAVSWFFAPKGENQVSVSRGGTPHELPLLTARQPVAIVPHPSHHLLLPHVGHQLPGTTTSPYSTRARKPARGVLGISRRTTGWVMISVGAHTRRLCTSIHLHWEFAFWDGRNDSITHKTCPQANQCTIPLEVSFVQRLEPGWLRRSWRRRKLGVRGGLVKHYVDGFSRLRAVQIFCSNQHIGDKVHQRA